MKKCCACAQSATSQADLNADPDAGGAPATNGGAAASGAEGASQTDATNGEGAAQETPAPAPPGLLALIEEHDEPENQAAGNGDANPAGAAGGNSAAGASAAGDSAAPADAKSADATPAGGESADASTASGAEKCCACPVDKVVTITFDLDKPADGAAMNEFNKNFITEVATALKIPENRIEIPGMGGSNNNTEAGNSTAAVTTEEPDLDLGEGLESSMSSEETAQIGDTKVVIEFKVKAGSSTGGKNATEIVKALKEQAENPTSALSQGKIFGNVDKRTPWTMVSESAEKSKCELALSTWDYSDAPGQAGPSNWTTSYPKCGIEGIQSPVRLPMSTPSSAEIVHEKLIFNYKDSKVKLENDGRNLNAVVDTGASMSVAGLENSDAVLQYITFHSPSEHVFVDDSGQDMRYAMEMQFHHKATTGQIQVVSVLFKVNAANPTLDILLKDVPKTCEDKKIKETPNLENLMPFERHFYQYKGTISVPPCTEPVTWYVLRQQGNLSMQQLKDLREKLQLDPIPLPEEAKTDPGSDIGPTKIGLIDKDLFPTYAYSNLLIGNVRPLQDFGERKLWATPA